MKKIVKLSESDLTKIVKRVISEGKKKYEFIDEHPSYDELKTKIKEVKKIISNISKEMEGDKGENKEYIIEYVSEELLK